MHRLALVLLVVAGVGLGAATWRWGISADMVTHLDDAHQLITYGVIPHRGTLTSFGSYTPPGITWLLTPGLLLFDDLRMAALPGAALLYAGTLVGVYVLGRRVLPQWSAVGAVALFGLSPVGLFFASSLWPRGNPFFFVWMLECLLRWGERRDGRWLAAALALYGAGLYVFMESLPAALAFPVVWWIYRPPLRLRPVLAAALVIALLWFPYLAYETERGFIDLRSQILRQSLVPSASIAESLP